MPPFKTLYRVNSIKLGKGSFIRKLSRIHQVVGFNISHVLLFCRQTKCLLASYKNICPHLLIRCGPLFMLAVLEMKYWVIKCSLLHIKVSFQLFVLLKGFQFLQQIHLDFVDTFMICIWNVVAGHCSAKANQSQRNHSDHLASL